MSYKEVCYDMSHKQRGHCVIFNHTDFDSHTGLGKRTGSEVSCQQLVTLFTRFGFIISVHENMTVSEVKATLCKYAYDIDHSDCDALVVIFMSHGERKNLYGRDGAFKEDVLFNEFLADRCPTLAGKPKIFFIDASRGEGTQNAVTLPKKENTESCQGVPAYTGNPIEVHLRQKGDIREEVIPKEIACHADFLKCWSTPPGYFSWRNTVTGSWFVQSLCQVLSRATGNEDIMDLLTKTNMVLNSTFQSNCPSIPNLHGKKQTAFFESTLTAKLYLTPSSFN
ncbi:caspase-1-like isoform X1 [Penaeus indicus]|uniref:caspase-1-like isoform X1 n=1 Tax=Penaeus indicus TaxID=29960 RepID=UPI00300D298F